MNPEFKTALGETVSIILGFTVFFHVMKRFAWGPILGMLDARRKAIADGYEEIKSLKAQTEEARKDFEARIKDIEAEARRHVQEAVNEGKALAADIVAKAQAEAAATAEKSKRTLEIEIAGAKKQLREDMVRLTLQATEKLIQQKLDEARDRDLVGSFIGEIEGKAR